MAILALDEHALSKVSAAAKKLRDTHPDISHNARMDVVVQEHGYQSYKSFKAAVEAAIADRGNPAERLVRRARSLGASAIHLSVRQAEVQVKMRVHGLLVEYPGIPLAAVDEVLKASDDTYSGSCVGGFEHVVHFHDQALTWGDMQAGPIARQVMEWWATNPKPGVLLVSSTALRVRPELVGAALLKYTVSKAMSGSHRVRMNTSQSEDDPLVAAANDKTILPLAAFGPDASVMRAKMRGLPDRMLASDEVFSICAHVETLPRICQRCCIGFTAKMVQPYEGDVDALNRFFGSMPRDTMRIRCQGPGCEHCHGLGTIGIKYLVEAHGITRQTLVAAKSRDWSNPGWMEALNAHVTRGRTETITDLATHAAATGEVDPRHAFDLVDGSFRS